ncbi:MAG TPA: hypothetical protein VGN01_06160 [Acidobacteriaceae bacterium]|jgi:hypothetical protein
MTMNSEPDGGASRDDLLQRIELMETMIAEGRQATARFGWIFVLWGLVDIGGMALEMAHPGHIWNWPVALTIGMALQFAGLSLRKRVGRECRPNTQARAVSAIWGMMGATLVMYCFTAIFSHQANGRGYLAAIFMTIGLAHAASAIILRWPVQGGVAVLWWAGGITCFFVSGAWFLTIFGVEMVFGMVLFGLYGIYLDHRSAQRIDGAHA